VTDKSTTRPLGMECGRPAGRPRVDRGQLGGGPSPTLPRHRVQGGCFYFSLAEPGQRSSASRPIARNCIGYPGIAPHAEE
jgi:hypothetical protein